MRLSRIVIRHFKAHAEIAFTIPKTDENRPGSANFVSIVGENNAGKSSILEAIHLACPGGETSVPLQEHFPYDVDQRRENPIEVEFHFDEIAEQDKLKHAIRNHVIDGVYRVKKLWVKPGAKPEQQPD